MKLKMIALAAVMVASGAANATLNLSTLNGSATSGGSIYVTLYAPGESAAVTVDLGVTAATFFTDLAPTAAGVNLDWNLFNSTFADTSATSTGLASSMKALNYGNVVSADTTAFTSGDSTLAVMGGTSKSSLIGAAAGSEAYVATSTNYPGSGSGTGLTNTNIQSFIDMNSFLTNINGDKASTTSTMTGSAAGAFAYSAATDTAPDYYGTGLTGYHAIAGLNPNTTMTNASFYEVANSSSSGAAQATVTAYAGTWSFNTATGDLVYSSAVAAVPEADSYAMLLAGLGMMGAIVRRRNSKAA